MTEERTLDIDDFRCPVCVRRVQPLPDPPGRNPRTMGFACPDLTCPVGLFWVAMGAPIEADRILAVKGVGDLVQLHQEIMKKQYRELKRKEAESN